MELSEPPPPSVMLKWQFNVQLYSEVYESLYLLPPFLCDVIYECSLSSFKIAITPCYLEVFKNLRKTKMMKSFWNKEFSSVHFFNWKMGFINCKSETRWLTSFFLSHCYCSFSYICCVKGFLISFFLASQHDK